MADKAVERLIGPIAESLSQQMQKEQPGVFNKDFWTGRMLEFSMRDAKFKLELFRFVDVYSVLKTPEQISQHIKEYFLRPEQDFPTTIKLSLKGLGTGLGQKLGGGTMAAQIEEMAKRFITGANSAEALAVLSKLRAEQVGFTLDLLGEAALSDQEAAVYLKRYGEAIDQLSEAAKGWAAVPVLDHDALGDIPKVNVSIKISSLFPAIDPLAFEASIDTLYQRLLPLLVRARQQGVFINLDLEQYSLKDLTFALFRRLREAPELAGYPHLGVVVQAYLKDAYADAEALIKFAKKSKQTFTIRLVKGAYWDYETILAKQRGWPAPVFEKKHETDANYEAITGLLLDAFPHIRLAVGSHNLRSIAHAVAHAEKNKLAKGSYEIQMLYGMAEPIRRALAKRGERVRVYAPVGELLPGMAYLVRRLLENTSNEGFLRQRFVESESLENLLKTPEEAPKEKNKPAPPRRLEDPFVNEPLADFALAEEREQFSAALNKQKASLPKQVPTVVSGKPVSGLTRTPRENPANLGQVVAQIDYATAAQAQAAVNAAHQAFAAWRDRPVEERAKLLLAAAEGFRRARHELSAVMLLEVGKTPREADADVCEAIDFCEYYARHAMRLLASHPQMELPGEDNQLTYEARGVVGVIAPWNFPAAILTGMTVAALVTGNTVLMKPAEQSSATGYMVYQILRDAGIPGDVLHFLPGAGEEVGAALARHHLTSLVAFTGSRDVGLTLLKGASLVVPEQDHLQRVILELGGKNAIIVDSDADMDEAVLGVMQSAFGFQGQKCSACSRAIVAEERYDEFLGRLVEATRSLRLGNPERYENTTGPVVDRDSFQRLSQAIANAKKDFRCLLGGETIDQQGYFVSPTIFADVSPSHALAQEELFGPVLAVIKAKDFGHALSIANGTRYALTGGVFSRSPDNLARARREFRVGNLYLNRGITGALVGRQPFGGFKLSGIGSKAGGADYLLQFVEPRVVTENTMRRGFAPEA